MSCSSATISRPAGYKRPTAGPSILRNIRSPIVVFCSKGDNVTPPQQALGWILDLYESVEDIRSHGQTIVYCVHETAGHLGIFVSGGVARKEHSEFSSNIDLIDVLPPGLYEAVFESKSGDVANPDLASGEWIMRCEARTLDDIRALGGNDADDERRFATAARVSEINLAMYRTFAQPFVRALVTPQAAEFMRRMHPLRMQYELFSSANPFMAWVRARRDAGTARSAREAAGDNPLVQMQEHASQADRRGAGCLAGHVGAGIGIDVPVDIRLAPAAGGGRNRSQRRCQEAQSGKDPLHRSSWCRSGSPS